MQPKSPKWFRRKRIEWRRRLKTVANIKSGRQILGKLSPDGKWHRPWWRMLIGLLIAVAATVFIMNPELAFLSFLLDPLILDVAILLLGARLLLFNGQIRVFVVSTYSGIRRRLSVLMKYRSDDLRWAYIFALCAVIASLGRHHFHGRVGLAFAIASGLLFLRKFLHGVVASYRRISSARAASTSRMDWVKEIIPPWIRGMVAVDRSIYSEVVCRIFCWPSPSVKLANNLPQGKRFTLSKGNVSTLLIPLVVIGLMSDVPISQVIIVIWRPAHALWLHAALLFAALWGLAWAVGDRFSICELRHVVTPSTLFLRVGFRWSCDIPIKAIKNCSIVDGRPRVWLASKLIKKEDVWLVTPVDRPRVLIEIDPNAVQLVSVFRMQTRVAGKIYVAVYVDDPEIFAFEVSMLLKPRDELSLVV